MKNILLILFLVALTVNVSANEIILPAENEGVKSVALTNSAYSNEVAHPENAKISVEDEEIKSLVWNRYVNKNFTVLSIDDKQGYWLYKNIDQINDWCVSRWGLPKIDFSKECRIFCVPNKSLLKKLFGLENSRVEVRKKDGEVDITVLWLVLEETEFHQVSPYLTRACFAELEQEGLKLSWWFTRSAEILSLPIKEIRDLLESSFEPSGSEAIFNTTFEDYQKLSAENKKLFDKKCLVLCLMLRKELGEIKLHSFLVVESKNKVEKSLNFVYGYSSIQEFEKKFLLFSNDLSKAIGSQKVPDSYLQITNVKKRRKL